MSCDTHTAVVTMTTYDAAGSAHTVLAPYWAAVLGVTSLSARQCSPRGGDLGLRVLEDRARLEVAGDSTLVMEGAIHVK